MGKVFFKNNWQIFVFNLVVIIAFIVGYGHFGDIMVDSFREAYIPAQIIKGQVLYKNIFNIYAPFSYLFNSLLFLIFGVHLKILYTAGLLATLGVLNLVFKISNEFMNKTYALSIVLFVISVGVLSPNVFNYIFPYSFGMLYGLLFILASIYFALKDKFQLAYLMYSFAICSKYEFALLLPLLLFVTRKNDLLKNIISLLLPIIITYTPLFVMNVGIENILASAQIILTMSSTKTLYWFYSITGLVFRPEILPIYLINLIKVLIPLLFMYYWRSWWLIILTVIYFYFATTPDLLIYIFPLILILFVIRFRKLSHEKIFFVLASLLISMKIFFAETFLSYGVFFIPFALISIFILIPPRFKKALFIITLICALNFGIKNTISLSQKNVKVEAERGVFYSATGEVINQVINYINKNTKSTDKVVIYPECLAVNFLTSRDSDNKFYSLIPLYVETFSEDVIIKRLDIIKPEYIVTSNYNTSNYYYSYFGQDYAGGIYGYVLSNYDKQADFGRKMSFIVYKRK